ncbi:FAD binding domain containing protein [Pyrenophora tritici-repentis Pt-1C-BFP]|uniref:FAD binding domain containing protein n=1 Tax=Pyrenophora tritici-repentis (strain Pt-1C-BFP) TaxID=426418 RepID=B2WI44_PYRTR|nr:FAD binding domain containing protein [Pyrenophora tritici-repentis Pt-1C-BFP]EDU42704.1 FAD binding domain containing protein [Pyrenophora tritici-repentis Pt-1C-BFP]
MAKSVASFTWERGFREPSAIPQWETDNDIDGTTLPPSKEVVTSSQHNDLGVNVLRTWPTLYDGTNNPHGIPAWWKPQKEVDVLICGAGPSGLEVAVSLARQGVSFRIIDKAEGPLIAGRADGVQPRFLETLATWGLEKEVAEEGPLIERTAIYKDGKKLLFGPSHQSDSRYRGLHIITQGQVERIYIRDLTRHKALVERSTIMSKFEMDESSSHSVQATLRNSRTGAEELVKAKFLVGSDGAASMVRKQLNIPFDGMSTDIYWGILDCRLDSDYPHAFVFGSVISSKHGGCVIIPREDGLYTQLDVSQTGPLAASRQAQDASFKEAGGRVDVHTITPEEVLEQANKIFAPYTLKFAAPLSWFAVWKISERVARSFSSPDNRAHILGDAAHVHSVMGAFGLNASIMDAANLAWKLGFVARKKAQFGALLPTYSSERRPHAVRIIKVSGRYLRFVCNADLHVAADMPDELKPMPLAEEPTGEFPERELKFLASFFQGNGHFLLGVDAPYDASVISPSPKQGKRVAINVRNGVRAPNPRVCFSTAETGYLYDKLVGADRLHIVLFASSLRGPSRQAISKFAEALGPSGFYQRFGGSSMFNIVVVVECVPFELDELLPHDGMDNLKQVATFVFDDRAPDENAHTTWGADRKNGGLAVIRPDLWVGITAPMDDVEMLDEYFGSFLVPAAQ